ncbi:epoxyqueuosine reductase QueH [bacterium]|nr:epoxyqueuosine reductase QueH [bacterium]
MAQNKIVLHACCGICSGYPISYLKDMGYEVVVYFYNPNIFPKEEYQKRLEAERILCAHFGVELVEAEYNQNEYYDFVKGLENEPEKGLRCDKCFELRLKKTAEYAKSNGIEQFTTSITISPHKNFDKLTKIGSDAAENTGVEYLSINFKKKDGFLKTNQIARELNLYRQYYCGCKFALS